MPPHVDFLPARITNEQAWNAPTTPAIAIAATTGPLDATTTATSTSSITSMTEENVPDNNNATTDRMIQSCSYQQVQQQTIPVSFARPSSLKITHHPRHRCQRSKRVVTFAPYLDIQDTIHIEDIKAQLNLNDLWYSNEDYSTILKDCNDIVRTFDHNLLSSRTKKGYGFCTPCHSKRNSWCQEDTLEHRRHYYHTHGDASHLYHHRNHPLVDRGLEWYTQQGEQQYQRRIKLAYSAVFAEQYTQRAAGRVNVESIAAAYFRQSFQAQLDAYKQGIRDEQALAEFDVDEERIQCIISELAFE